MRAEHLHEALGSSLCIQKKQKNKNKLHKKVLTNKAGDSGPRL